MPRKTKLSECCKCEGPAMVGTFVGFYLLGSNRAEGQHRGAFPSRGFCGKCFLGIAKQRLTKGKFLAVRDLLERRGQ